MRILVYARYSLIGNSSIGNGLIGNGLPDDQPALLLEGAWPDGTRHDTPNDAPDDTTAAPRWSLDRAIDGRFDWIDRLAADWARSLARADPPTGDAQSPADPIALVDALSPAHLNALALQYYLVKLIRLLVYFTEVRPFRAEDQIELTAATGCDEDYAEIVWQHCRAVGAEYSVRWVEGRQRRAAAFPPNRLWRRWAARLSRSVLPAPERADSHRRVVLCGNPRVLDSVCRQLLMRRCNLWWLYDRFAVRSWVRWQAAGVGQLVCNSSLGRENGLRACPPEQFEFRGVDLALPIRRWLAGQITAHGPAQTHLIQQIDEHFREVRPDALVLDQDATPLARVAVAVARRHGARSFVVQHGAPCCRFGFSPLVADRFLAWGSSSRERLIRWGVPPEQICVTGSPQHEDRHEDRRRDDGRSLGRPAADSSTAPGKRLAAAAVPATVVPVAVAPVAGVRAMYQEVRPPRILFLATVPPRDDRPDAIAMHLTTETHAEMLRIAMAAVAGIHGVELLIRPHPRSPADRVLRAMRSRFPALRSRMARRGPLQKWLRGVHCVLSCGSSAGVEAAFAGLPVVQLAPPGASGTLPHDAWGLVGTAHSQTELERLLARVLVDGWRPAPDSVARAFAQHGKAAAARIADEVLAPTPVEPEPTREVPPLARPSVPETRWDGPSATPVNTASTSNTS